MKTYRSREISIKVTAIDYHRNGVCGVGFYVILFKEGESNKVATVFPLNSGEFFKEKEQNGMVSVFDVDMLSQGNIRFAENSWRGDRYEPMLREAIKDNE